MNATRRGRSLLPLPALLLATLPAALAGQAGPFGTSAAPAVAETEAGRAPAPRVRTAAMARPLALFESDLQALREFRPAYPFWQNIFTVPDGSVAIGSARDGRLLAVLPARGDWSREGRWVEGGLAEIARSARLSGPLDQRRSELAGVLAAEIGPVVQNATRGNFLLPNARRYGAFIGEWAEIYERFGVPAEIGLAQAILESGLNGRVQSEARAIGFCQWLPENWRRLQRLAHHEIEARNQTTQAPYCAAYLTILATKYGSFIPALSEHHAGGTNVGRMTIAGARLGGADARERYLLGARFARDLREIAPGEYREVYGTYGPRSFLYAEMVFGNAETVRRLMQETPQRKVFAMRAPRAIPLSEITRRTGLSADEVKRFNPALVNRIPAGANLYLPRYVPEYGADVSFWHRPMPAPYAAVLEDFLRLEAPLERWNDPAFRPTLEGFARRFAATGTEEGRIFATVLTYAADEMYTSGRPRILAEYSGSERVRMLIERGQRERRLAGALEPSIVVPPREGPSLRGPIPAGR